MYGTDYDEATGYEDFTIAFSSTGQPGASFKLSATSANGETIAFDYYPPVTSFEIDEALAGVTRANAQFALSVPRTSSDEIRALGERLYSSVWQSGITDLYQYSSRLAKDKGKNLRLRFMINDPELAALPWEFLFDPSRKDFLTLSARTPLARKWSSWPTPPPLPSFVEPPLRVLVIEAEVRAWDIGAEPEIDSLRKLANRNPPVLELVDVIHNATFSAFLDAVFKPYDVLHLCLTGATREGIPGFGTGSGFPVSKMVADSLVFIDEKSGVNRVPHRIDLESLRIAIGKSGLRLIYLSGDCTDWLASQLTEVSPATLGWRGLNTSEAYFSFTKGFYSALTRGLPLESAVTHGRKAVDADYPGGKEWGMPVFYMQTPDGFAVSKPKRTRAVSGPVLESVIGSSDVLSGPSNPANQREWTKLSVLLSVAEENYRAVVDEVGKYVDVGEAVPQHLESQSQELQTSISTLRKDLERLAQ